MLYDEFWSTVSRAYDEGISANEIGKALTCNPYCMKKTGIDADLERECHIAWNCGFKGTQLPLT